jgi:hypothetical protein
MVKTASTSQTGVASGDALGNYRLERVLGSGGQAEVWLATDIILERLVAVKIFHKNAAGGDIDQDGLREARLIATLDHPNIVRIYHVGHDRGVWFMATEFVDGGSLYMRLKRIGALKPDEALQFASNAADALQHAHHIGVIHRDLKPQNFLVTRKRQLKLADFGLASLMDFSGTSQMSTRLVGTPQFMPPEIWLGKNATVETDIYSLGACLYFMVTGEPPFPDPTVEALKKAHLERRPAIPTRVPSAVANIVHYCMAKKQSDRPRSAKDLKQELQYCLGIVTGDRRLSQRKPKSLEKGEGTELGEAIANWSAAENAVMQVEPFGPARARLTAALQGASLILLHGPHTKAHGRIVRQVLDERSDRIFLIARLVLGGQSGDLVSNLAKLLNVQGAVPKIYDQLAEELRANCSENMPGVLHLHIDRELKPMEAIQLIELGKRIDKDLLTLLVTCPADVGAALIAEAEAGGAESIMTDISLRKMSASETFHYFKTMSDNATEGKVWWSNDALLLAVDQVQNDPGTIDRIGQNAIMMAMLTGNKVITSWCVVGAAAHQKRLIGSGDLMTEWKTPPSVWPDESTLKRLIELRKNIPTDT